MASRPAPAQLHMCHNQTKTVIPTHNFTHKGSRESCIPSYLLFFSLSTFESSTFLSAIISFSIPFFLLRPHNTHVHTHSSLTDSHTAPLFSHFSIMFCSVPPPTLFPPTHTHTPSPHSSVMLHPLVFSRLVSDRRLTFQPVYQTCCTFSRLVVAAYYVR